MGYFSLKCGDIEYCIEPLLFGQAYLARYQNGLLVDDKEVIEDSEVIVTMKKIADDEGVDITDWSYSFF